MKNKVYLLQKKFVWVQPFIAANSVLKGDLIFAHEEGVPRGHPQALTLVPLGYFLG
jgi:hypothetical protein